MTTHLPSTPSGLRLRFIREDAPAGDLLLTVFLRGAADGLNIVVPHGDTDYYRQRPNLAIVRPDDRSADPGDRCLDLDGFFGLHPALAPLLPAWQARHLACVHACGAPDESRSHFRAMELMERGVASETGPASGWIARHLATRADDAPSPLRALAWGTAPQRSLSGAGPVATLRDLQEIQLAREPRQAARLSHLIDSLYSVEPGPLEAIGRETLQLSARLQHISLDPSSDLPYPPTEFGRGLQQLACLVRADAGVEAAAIDLGGWDTHYAQGGAKGVMARQLAELASGLAAFHEDLAPFWARLSVVVMTEFGRRVKENGSLGTDHGHGSVMLILGGHVAGGKVHGTWPGLAAYDLVGPGDLAVTTDYRDLLAELCQHRLRNPALDQIFPGFTPTTRDVFVT